MFAPVMNSLNMSLMLSEILNGVTTFLIIYAVILSGLVIYALMLTDVNEQTYQFGMMRALGFKQRHVMIFVIFQALTFAIPGVLLGLLISFILNDAMREVMFVMVQLSTSYGLPNWVVYFVLLLFGLVLPVVSILGPTSQALGKNLRTSLDAS